MIYFLVGIGYLVDILFIVHDNEKHDVFSIVLKTGASLCFVLLSYILLTKANNPLIGKYILYALIADLFGDFVLILRNVFPKYHDLIFYVGTGMFLIGHIFLMIMLYINNPDVILSSILFSIILFLSIGFYMLKTLEAKRVFKVVGGIYLYFILFILVYSACSYWNNETRFDLAFLFGYFLFAISDVILIIQKFNKKASNTLQPIYRLSYFISQILIALSIAYL